MEKGMLQERRAPFWKMNCAVVRPTLGKLERYTYGKRHICPVCGKSFSIQTGMHMYWRYRFVSGGIRKYCCGYGCYVKKMKGGVDVC